MLAQSLENAARMAIADLNGVNIDLRVYNTAGDPATGQAAALRAVDDGANIILGPVFAEVANAVGVAVSGRGVNVLSFSNNTSIAGGNLFVLGPTFDNTANRLVSYAVRQGKTRITVAHDDNVAGQAGNAAIQRAIRANGAQAAGIVAYEFSRSGVQAAAPRIRSAVDGNGADALMLAANSAGALPLLAQVLPEAGVRSSDLQFIGLTRWDIPVQTLSLPGIQGGWFALPDPTMSARFDGRYAATYGSTPHPIGGLAYDGIAAIGALVKAGNRDALTGRALTQGAGFQGVTGVFRLRPDGTNERGLAIAAVRNQRVVVIDPAPRGFGGAGF